MFKNHPKGLLAASLANMGERFGFYTMMAILTLFLMTKFGLDETTTGIIYSIFYASIYLLALVGGCSGRQDPQLQGIIMTGLLLMSAGYVIIAIPTPTPVRLTSSHCSLQSAAGPAGDRFRKRPLQGEPAGAGGADMMIPKYSKMRDSGFQLFYMFINIGAIFAPFLAVGVRNWWVEKNGFLYNADLPTLAHQYWAIPSRRGKRTFSASGRRSGIQWQRHDSFCR